MVRTEVHRWVGSLTGDSALKVLIDARTTCWCTLEAMTESPETLSYWRRQRVIVAVVVAMMTTGGYLSLLGWHQLQGYDRSKATYLVLLLALLAAWSGWRRPYVVGSLVLTSTLVVLWSVDAATNASDGANLWPIGAVMLASTTAAGAFLISWLVWMIRTAQVRRTIDRLHSAVDRDGAATTSGGNSDEEV
jgi:uncharacterized integral membrane protein